MDLDLLRDRRVVTAAACAALVLFAILGIGVGLLVRGHRHKPPESTAIEQSSAPPRSLQVEMGRDEGVLDTKRPLRCFAGGQFVGMTTLADCAKKNGVAPGGLDVGLDTTGAVAATTADASVLQPLPSAPVPPPAPESAPAPAVGPASVGAPGAAAACWRFAGDWRKIGDDTSLANCVQTLFSGRCERPGAADYGRWNGDTLRLVTGRVEIAGDNRSFRPLALQSPGSCTIANLAE